MRSIRRILVAVKDPSLVVMGAISRSGLKRLFIGNTAESLLDQLLCDVLIVKPAHFVARMQRRRRGVPLAALVAPPGM
jgi:universal stress protein family protein